MKTLLFIALKVYTILLSMIVTLIEILTPGLSFIKMAITQNPIIGRASGKLGPNIFLTLWGNNVLRTKPIVVNQPNTPEQLNRRGVFGFAQRFASSSKSFFNNVYSGMFQNKSVYAYVIGHLLKNYVKGTYPNKTVDLENAVFPLGALPQPDATLYEIGGSNSEISFKIEADDIEIGSEIYMLVFCPDKQFYLPLKASASVEGSFTSSVTVPQSIAGENVGILFAYSDVAHKIKSIILNPGLIDLSA